MIVSGAVAVRNLILDLTMALTIGFALGYGVREWISRRRRQAERRRRGVDGGVLAHVACRNVQPRAGEPCGPGRLLARQRLSLGRRSRQQPFAGPGMVS